MKKNYLIILIICLGIILGWGWKSINFNNNKFSLAPVPFVDPVPTLIPTPTPPVFNQNSNLLEELNKYTPADFSSDYQDLKAEVSNL